MLLDSLLVPMEVPEFREGRKGLWTLTHEPEPIGLWSYRSMFVVTSGIWRLMLGNTTWMSNTPMELESQALFVKHAKGHTVVAGLGMGIVLYNMIKRPGVHKVTVLEQDEEVIEAFMHFAQPENWENWEKVEIVNTNALLWSTNEKVDFLYVDIWPEIGTDQAIKDTQLINGNIRAETVGYWGQEFDFVEWCSQSGVKVNDVNGKNWKEFRRYSKLRLVPNKLLDVYAEFAVNAMKNMVLAHQYMRTPLKFKD